MLAQSVELRDSYTGNHTARVTEYSYLLAQQMDLSQEELHWIRLGTPLHDIGKIGIDDAILRKPGKLTPAEFEIMKSHTTKGARILEQVPDMQPVTSSSAPTTALGRLATGRPRARTSLPGLHVAVADAFDAMTTDRLRAGMPYGAFAEVEKVGKQLIRHGSRSRHPAARRPEITRSRSSASSSAAPDPHADPQSF